MANKTYPMHHLEIAGIEGDMQTFEVVDESARKTCAEAVSAIYQVRRKVMPMTGDLRVMTRRMDTMRDDIDTISASKPVRIFKVVETTDETTGAVNGRHMTIGVGNIPYAVSIDLFEDNQANLGTIKFLRNFGTIHRNQLYLANTTHWVAGEDAEVHFYFDGIEKANADITKGSSYTSIMITKKLTTNRFYITQIDSTGITLSILSDVHDLDKSTIPNSVNFNTEYDTTQLTIYKCLGNGATFTMSRNGLWQESTETEKHWHIAKIHW